MRFLRKMPFKSLAPEQHAEVCTFTPRVGASPSLTVTLLPLPGKNVSAKPVCNEGALKTVGMASCFGVARGNMVTVSLVSPKATFAALNATLRARFGRLVDGGAAK